MLEAGFTAGLTSDVGNVVISLSTIQEKLYIWLTDGGHNVTLLTAKMLTVLLVISIHLMQVFTLAICSHASPASAMKLFHSCWSI